MEPIYTLKGRGNILNVYEDKLVIKTKGVLGFLVQGLAGDKTIPMESVRSVQFRKGGSFVNGFIQFGIAGAIEKQGGVLNAAGDENSVVFYKEYNETAERIKLYVEDFISNRNNKFQIQQNSIQKISDADEIKKYKELLDQGIISSEEFEAKKKQILNL